MLTSLSRYRKGIAGFLGSLATWGLAAHEGGYTAGEWWALLGVLAATAGVVGVANTPPNGQPSDPNISETDPQRADYQGQHEAGHGELRLIAAIAAGILVAALVLWLLPL